MPWVKGTGSREPCRMDGANCTKTGRISRRSKAAPPSSTSQSVQAPSTKHQAPSAARGELRCRYSAAFQRECLALVPSLKPSSPATHVRGTTTPRTRPPTRICAAGPAKVRLCRMRMLLVPLLVLPAILCPCPCVHLPNFTVCWQACTVARSEHIPVIAQSARQLMPHQPSSSDGGIMSSHHSLFHRPKTSHGNLLSPGLGGHQVSFSDSSKSTDKRHSSSARPSSRPSSSSNSRPSSPAPQHQQKRAAPAPAQRIPSSQTRAYHQPWNESRNLQRINRQSEALWQYEL